MLLMLIPLLGALPEPDSTLKIDNESVGTLRTNTAHLATVLLATQHVNVCSTEE
jgi:hypothetical protein